MLSEHALHLVTPEDAVGGSRLTAPERLLDPALEPRHARSQLANGTAVPGA
jgi:hypothetical protein